MKLQRYLQSAVALALVSAAAAAEEAPAVIRPVEVPTITLPPFKPVGVAKFDATKIKAAPWDLQQIKAPEAWAKNPAAKGKGVRVAILDTGCQNDHPGLNGRVVASYNAIDKSRNVTDRHGHGTWCVGAVHAVVPEADLIVVKVLNDNGSGRVDQIAHGIDWAVTEGKADVLSLSLGGPTPDTFQQPAIQRAIAAGVVVVCAAGNDGGPRDTEGYPGRYPESISVGASTRDGRLASFSSWGPNVFTVDPGDNVTGLLPGNQEGEMSGTSMACPKAAGKCASWIASNAIAKDARRSILFRRAVIDASPFKERNNARGHGLYTLDKITGTAAPKPPPPVPGKPLVVTITLGDLSPAKQAELIAGGVTTFKLEVGHGQGGTQPSGPAVLPMPSVKQAPAPVPVPTPQPVPGYWSPPAQPWYQPIPQPVPMRMPGGCPGGVCLTPIYQPAPAQILPQFRPFGGRFR